MHAEAYAFVEDIAKRIGRRQSVIEIGSRNINGTVRPLFNGAQYTGIDPVPGFGVDLIADGASYQPPAKVDTVICCEVLEHTAQAEQIVANALRMLQPDGMLLITCAAPPRAPHSALDGAELQPGEYYHNIGPEVLTDWIETHGGQVQVSHYAPERGDVYVWARRVK